MIVYEIEYRPDDEQVWHNCLIGVRNRSEGERYQAGVNRGEDEVEILNKMLKPLGYTDDDIMRYWDIEDLPSQLYTRKGYDDGGIYYRQANAEYDYADKIEPLYLRWKQAMGGDDPAYDNEFDDFIRWIEYEVEECEVENGTADWQEVKND